MSFSLPGNEFRKAKNITMTPKIPFIFQDTDEMATMFLYLSLMAEQEYYDSTQEGSNSHQVAFDKTSMMFNKAAFQNQFRIMFLGLRLHLFDISESKVSCVIQNKSLN